MDEKEIDYKKKYKKWRRSTIIALIGLLIYVFIFIFLMRNMVWVPNLSEDVKLEFIGMTEEEKTLAESMVNDIEFPYLVFIESITFSKEFEDACNFICRLSCREECSGISIMGKDIIVEYNEDLKVTRNTLCHELLHSFILGGDSYRHSVVYELANKEVCYD